MGVVTQSEVGGGAVKKGEVGGAVKKGEVGRWVVVHRVKVVDVVTQGEVGGCCYTG